MPHPQSNQKGVPLVDLQAQLRPLRDEILAATQRVIDSGHYILGPEVNALEQELASDCRCKHAVGVSSGTDALLIAMLALDIRPGDEVITTAYSFFATAGCIARLGAKPVFIDIRPDTYNIDHEAIESASTPRTKAIIPVHLFGQVAEMDPIHDVAERHGLVVIEDAAQALGATYHTRRAGSLGHMGCFSFFPTKNLGAMGDGGMVVTDDDQLADRLRMLRSHGFQPKYHAKILGGNFRLDALQAAILRVKRKHLERWTTARQSAASAYRRLFLQARLASEDAKEGPLVLPHEAAERRHVFHQFVVRVRKGLRDALVKHLDANRIGCAIYYPVPLHLQGCLGSLGYHAGDFPHAESAAADTIALPMFAELTEGQQAQVVEAVASFFASR